VELCKTLHWDRLALLHDDSVWGTGGAAAIKTSFEAANGEVITTVDFDLAAFDAGTVHARELLARLAAASPRVIVLVTQLRVQRALCTQHTDSNTELTPDQFL
jgi:ABC-type branched-subunit amino acid transport system substrate-binding protein